MRQPNISEFIITVNGQALNNIIHKQYGCRRCLKRRLTEERHGGGALSGCGHYPVGNDLADRQARGYAGSKRRRQALVATLLQLRVRWAEKLTGSLPDRRQYRTAAAVFHAMHRHLVLYFTGRSGGWPLRIGAGG